MAFDIAYLLRYARACLFRATGLLRLARRRAARRGVVVLTLHRVLDDTEFSHSSSLPATLVRQKTFEALVRWITRNFDVLDLRNGFLSWEEHERPRVAVTFDDGWLDNYEIAEPIATRYRCPVAIFVCPDLTGKPFPFWPERVNSLLAKIPNLTELPELARFCACSPLETREKIIEYMKQRPACERDRLIAQLEAASGSAANPVDSEPLNRAMGWEQIRELSLRGVCIGSHTFSHQILTSVPAATCRRELTLSRREIESRLQMPCALLAYPNGNHDRSVYLLAAEAGYTLAFANRPGCWTKDTDFLQIPRVNIWERKLTSPAGHFSSAMAEYYLFWQTRSDNSRHLTSQPLKNTEILEAIRPAHS